MNTTKKYICISLLCMFVSILLFGYFNEWIIIQSPFIQKKRLLSDQPTIEKKQISFYYWKKNTWIHEQSTMMISKSTEKKIAQIINRLCLILYQEKIISNLPSVQSIALTSSGTIAYLSFTLSPIQHLATTRKKLMILESILKTIRENTDTIQDVYFLVHHTVLQDEDFNFNIPWPILGFIK